MRTMHRASFDVPASSRGPVERASGAVKSPPPFSGSPRKRRGKSSAALPNGTAGKYIPWITVKPASGVAFSIPYRPKQIGNNRPGLRGENKLFRLRLRRFREAFSTYVERGVRVGYPANDAGFLAIFRGTSGNGTAAPTKSGTQDLAGEGRKNSSVFA